MTPALDLRGLALRYKRFTLGPIDLRLEPGRVVGLIGPNGSGKTTTLRCVAGNLYPDAGSIVVHGWTARTNDAGWKAMIGYVPDRPEFFEHQRAGAFLRLISHLYPDWSDTLARELIHRFRLDPQRKVKQLSAGDRMKVWLIAALAHRPKLALFDEPTAGLDPVVRSEVFDVMGTMMESEEMTILYSTHILDDLHRLADELVFLDRGQVRLHAAKDDLIDSWRRIRFRRNGESREVVSQDVPTTLTELSGSGAETVSVSPLTLEEIAVAIMKGD